jgi:hypothetical protein
MFSNRNFVPKIFFEFYTLSSFTVLNKGLKEQMKKMNQLATAFIYIENIKSTKTKKH